MHHLGEVNGYGSIGPPSRQPDVGTEGANGKIVLDSGDCDFEDYYVPLKGFPQDGISLEKSVSSRRKAPLGNVFDVMLSSLGFGKNPILASPDTMNTTPDTPISSNREVHKSTSKDLNSNHKRNSSHADMRLSMVSNFSAAYNTINISLGLTFMKLLHPPMHPTDMSLCSSALIAGMIIGQLVGGLLGDWLGRHMAMSVVMTLQVAGAFWSAWVGLLGIGHTLGFYRMLALWRFLLGVGCGGVYPLAATLTAESSQREDKEKLVALTFSMQGVGYLAANVTAFVLVHAVGEELGWRLLFGFGW